MDPSSQAVMDIYTALLAGGYSPEQAALWMMYAGILGYWGVLTLLAMAE